MLVTVVDEIAEVVSIAKSASGREVARGLVAPGGIQRVLGDRQQFDMGKACLFDVIDQTVRQFTVVKELAIFITLP